MNIEFEIEEEYFDRAEKAECQVAFLGLVTRARLLTVFVAGMSPVDFEEARADLMAKAPIYMTHQKESQNERI